MKPLLLDTHVVIWWLSTPQRLNRQAYRSIERGDACVSVISLWEMLLKLERGNLKLPAGDLGALLAAQGFRVLPLHVQHVQAAADLGGLHADPNDRMIVGTARAERMVLVTRDARILERAAPILGDLLMEA
ncbi:MAG: type II toxin-antitoxin system VapC family toxin [Methylibium sp.]|nr:type II toxin-antitoxin system VapC family toxin [Methylibium sp.]